MTEKREYDRDREPVSLDGQDGRDPSNTEIEELIAPLAPDDDVYTLVNPDQGDLRETAPVGEHLGKRPTE